MKKKQILLAIFVAAVLTGCSSEKNNNVPATTPTEVPVVTEAVATATDTPVPTEEPVFKDWADTLKLDMSSETKKCEVTVKSYIDGDTVHFNVPTDVDESGVLKARFIAINTPESTGKIEEYGKTASYFTKETLSKATSIILESDTDTWNLDSTGGRYLVWIWYKTADMADYRNLNIEILQNGLAIASSSNNNRYGSTAMSAIATAKSCKMNIYSGQKDPNFYYGDAIELTIKELRLNAEKYTGQKVAFEGVVTFNDDSAVYIEELDPETGLYNGFYIYYGYNLSGGGLEILTVGNRVRIVGSCQFYEVGGTYQVSDVSYRQMKPDDPGNIQKIGDGYSPAYVNVSANDFVNGTITVVDEDGNEKTIPEAEFILNSSVCMDNLKVVSVYTTQNPASSSNGAMTLTCEAEDGTKVSVRTTVLYDDSKNIITADKYEGKTISVKGVVDYFDGGYQIKVLSDKQITINN